MIQKKGAGTYSPIFELLKVRIWRVLQVYGACAVLGSLITATPANALPTSPTDNKSAIRYSLGVVIADFDFVFLKWC